MECSAARRLIDMELDGELTPEEARALDEHARACVVCRRERELLLAVDRVLGEEPLERPPVAFQSHVMAEVVHRAELRRRVDSVVVPSACAAASVAAGYGIYRIFNWEVARSFFQGLGSAASQFASPVTSQLSGASGATAAAPPGESVVGIAIAFAVAGIVFIGVTAARLLRHHPHPQHNGWH